MFIEFTVPGEPVAKGRARAFIRCGKIGHYTPDKTATYESLVRLFASRAMGNKPLMTGAVKVVIRLGVALPAGWSQKKRFSAIADEILPTSKPDADNCAKGVLDAMNKIVFLDDKQVVDLVISKRYMMPAMTKVEVTTL